MHVCVMYVIMAWKEYMWFLCSTVTKTHVCVSLSFPCLKFRHLHLSYITFIRKIVPYCPVINNTSTLAPGRWWCSSCIRHVKLLYILWTVHC